MTDHKPLTTILGPKQGIPPLVAARMQRWALLLSAYSYEICFRPTTAHSNADGLSQLLTVGSVQRATLTETSVVNLAQLDALPLHTAEIKGATRNEPILRKVMGYMKRGWPDKVAECLLPYSRRRNELTVEGGCILWGLTVVIPTKLRERVMAELHVGHPGVVQMKALAWSHVWWPKMDGEIETRAKSCLSCQANKHLPPKAPLLCWPWPSVPWERIHVDYAGPVMGKMLLVVVDAHPKWPEICIMSSTTSSKTITALRDIFAHFGLPKHLVSDNGPQFISEEFEQFLVENGVNHIWSSPYHPFTNGAAKRVMQTVKQALRAGRQDRRSLEHILATFLLQYCTTPHATTGVPPSSLLLGRDLRTRLVLLSLSVQDRVERQLCMQQEQHDKHSPFRELSTKQPVWARNFRDGPRWVQGVIADHVGPLSYLVRMPDGNLWRRHIDHLREGREITQSSIHGDDQPQPPDPDSVETGDPLLPLTTEVPVLTPSNGSVVELTSDRSNGNSAALDSTSVRQPEPEQPQPRRYPTRTRKCPDRLYSSLSEEHSN